MFQLLLGWLSHSSAMQSSSAPPLEWVADEDEATQIARWATWMVQHRHVQLPTFAMPMRVHLWFPYMTDGAFDDDYIARTNPPPAVMRELRRLATFGTGEDDDDETTRIKMQFYFAGERFFELCLPLHFDERIAPEQRVISSFSIRLTNAEERVLQAVWSGALGTAGRSGGQFGIMHNTKGNSGIAQRRVVT